MAFPLPWYGAQAAVKIGGTIAVDDTTALWGQVSGTDYTGEVTEVRITGGEADVSVMNFLGTTQKIDQSRPTMVSAEFSKAFKDRAWLEMAYGSGSSVGTTGFTRVSLTDKTGNREKKAVALQFSDGTNKATWLLNNSVMTVTHDITVPNEGPVEDSVTIKALVDDVDFEDNS